MDIVTNLAEKAGKIRVEMLEQLAAAYVLKTGITPDQCELVEQHTPTGMTWFFRKRGEIPERPKTFMEQIAPAGLFPTTTPAEARAAEPQCEVPFFATPYPLGCELEVEMDTREAQLADTIEAPNGKLFVLVAKVSDTRARLVPLPEGTQPKFQRRKWKPAPQTVCPVCHFPDSVHHAFCVNALPGCGRCGVVDGHAPGCERLECSCSKETIMQSGCQCGGN